MKNQVVKCCARKSANNAENIQTSGWNINFLCVFVYIKTYNFAQVSKILQRCTTPSRRHLETLL